MTVEPDKLHLANLERIERRFENLLRDLRIFRSELESSSRDKGVLGTRSLTEYVLGLISGGPCRLSDMLTLAEQAGYAVPTRRIMSKRLTERAYRVGDIRYDSGQGVWEHSE